MNTKEITRLETVENRDQIISEIIKKANSFSGIGVHIDSSLNNLEIENFGAFRDSIEFKFGVYILNDEWESLATINDIVDCVGKKVTYK